MSNPVGWSWTLLRAEDSALKLSTSRVAVKTRIPQKTWWKWQNSICPHDCWQHWTNLELVFCSSWKWDIFETQKLQAFLRAECSDTRHKGKMHESVCKRQWRETKSQEGLITNKKWKKTRGSGTHLLKYSMLLQWSNIRRKQDDLEECQSSKKSSVTSFFSSTFQSWLKG